MSSFYIPRPYYTSILYQYVKSPWINSYVYFAVCISEISHYFYFNSARKIHVSLFQLIYFLNKNSLMMTLASIFVFHSSKKESFLGFYEVIKTGGGGGGDQISN